MGKGWKCSEPHQHRNRNRQSIGFPWPRGLKSAASKALVGAVVGRIDGLVVTACTLVVAVVIVSTSLDSSAAMVSSAALVVVVLISLAVVMVMPPSGLLRIQMPSRSQTTLVQ